MKTDRMRTESPGKLLLSLSVPAICAQIITILYNTVDRIYIGRMADGTMAMAGIGLCVPIVTLLTAFSGLFGQGGAPLAAITLGKGDQEQSERYLGNSFFCLTASSLIIMAGVLLFMEPLLRMFGASDNTYPYASDYLTVYLCGTLFVQLTVGMNYYITTQGFARTAMTTTMLGAVLNIFLDPIFIFSMNMGIRGAALATVVAQMFSCAFVLAFMFGKKTKLHLRLKCMRLHGPTLCRILSLGAAPFFMTGSEGILQITFNMQVLKYGGDLAVGVMTILFSLFQFINLPAKGIAQGSQPIVGYNYGAGEYGRVKDTCRLAARVATVYSVAAAALMILFPEFFIRLFNSDPELVAMGGPMLRVYIFGCLLIGGNTIYQQTYTSLGDGKVSFFFAFLRKVILLIPLLFILPAIFPWGVLAVVLAEPVSDIITSISNKFYFEVFLRKKLGR